MLDLKDLYILIGFVNITWISKSVKIHKPITAVYIWLIRVLI